MKIKNYSLASLHCGKQKPARSHQGLFLPLSTLSTPGRLTSRRGMAAGSHALLSHNSHFISGADKGAAAPSACHLGGTSHGCAEHMVLPHGLWISDKLASSRETRLKTPSWGLRRDMCPSLQSIMWHHLTCVKHKVINPLQAPRTKPCVGYVMEIAVKG